MNKDVSKFALIGLAAGFCLSAQAAPSQNDMEIAMTKCTRDQSQSNCNSQKSSCKSKCGSGDESSCSSCKSCNCSGNQSKASKMKNKRRSAAQKVVQGD